MNLAMNIAEQNQIEAEQLRTDLVCAYHVLDLEGQGSGLGGHVTARVGGEEAFWSHPFGLAFEEVTVADLIKLDFELNKLEGNGRVNPTLIFHSRIYQARVAAQKSRLDFGRAADCRCGYRRDHS